MLNPSAALLCKLASVIVHAEEYLSPKGDGHSLDLEAFRSNVADPEVQEWLAQMTAAAMAPKKRNA